METTAWKGSMMAKIYCQDCAHFYYLTSFLGDSPGCDATIVIDRPIAPETVLRYPGRDNRRNNCQDFIQRTGEVRKVAMHFDAATPPKRSRWNKLWNFLLGHG